MTTLAGRRIAILGFGAIGREIHSTLHRLGNTECLRAILMKPHQVEATRQAAPGIDVVDSVDRLVALAPDVVAECAGHEAVASALEPLLQAGIDVVVASVGALVGLKRTVTRPDPGRVLIPSGAVAGIDGLLAARTAGLSEVTYTSIKPPLAWRGTPAEAAAAGSDVRRVVFEGSAREAATQFPRNANVAATVAYAGLGLDATRVRLVSDPAASAPLGVIEAAGTFGRFRFEALAYAAPSNPKTSLLTAHSMIAACCEGVCFELSG